MSKIYLVKYCGGDWDSNYTVNIFATTTKSKATKYVSRFNKILKKWKNYYSKYEDNTMGFNWIKEEYIDQHFNRWNSLRDIKRCCYEEIDIR